MSPFDPRSVDLTGQVAVVTGAGRGLGRAFAQALAGAGASVAVLARSGAELAQTAELIESAGGRALALSCDVTDADLVRKATADIVHALGPIDLLVNNAGAVGPIGPFWETDVEEWWRVIEANLRSAVLCSRMVLPAMIARRRGRIVNVASGGGARPIAYFSGYGAGKTAMIRFAECIAAEAKPFSVSVFSLGPGTVRTAMSEHSLESPEGRTWLPWFRRIFDEGLDVPPERPAQLALVLASGRADPLSGCFLQVSDDVDAIVARADQVMADKLYSLRVRGFEAAKPPSATVAAIAAASEHAVDDG